MLAIHISSLEKSLFRSFAHFLIRSLVFLLLRCMSSLYSLDISPLSDTWFANIFTQLLGCLFILLMVSFAVQKLFSLMWSHLFIFSFVSLAWSDTVLENMLLRPMSKSILPMFFSRSFKVSGLTSKSLIHFELIFVHGVREWSTFILLHVAIQLSQHHLLKRLSFLHCMLLAPLSNISCP
uniref:Uncharacterized protein n=1 Tax=Equus caballus TaxID=9796 RepID=A0A9L0T2N9_HORSE